MFGKPKILKISNSQYPIPNDLLSVTKEKGDPSADGGKMGNSSTFFGRR
jgi:hypothetical protein